MNRFASYSDQELFRLVKAGQAAAYTELFNRYWQTLYKKAAYILDNPAVAEDIIQDVFFSIWGRREELEIESVKAWLEQAMRFQVFKAIRDEKAGRLFQQRLSEVTVDILRDDPILFKEHQQLLDYLINQLPEDCREAFRLSRAQELSYREIATALHISERTVRHRIAKSLELLRTHYSYLFVFIFLV